jgi:hypothetical protein
MGNQWFLYLFVSTPAFDTYYEKLHIMPDTGRIVALVQKTKNYKACSSAAG